MTIHVCKSAERWCQSWCRHCFETQFTAHKRRTGTARGHAIRKVQREYPYLFLIPACVSALVPIFVLLLLLIAFHKRANVVRRHLGTRSGVSHTAGQRALEYLHVASHSTQISAWRAGLANGRGNT